MPQSHAGILTLRDSEEESAGGVNRSICRELILSYDVLRLGIHDSPSLQGPFMLEVEALIAGE
jgi:hypothetical protein